MADEDIPDNIDLRFIARQNTRILRELAEVREQTAHIPQLRADVTELQHAMAATRADIAIIKDTVEDIKETSRLMEGRLFRLEKHAGFAKA